MERPFAGAATADVYGVIRLPETSTPPTLSAPARFGSQVSVMPLLVALPLTAPGLACAPGSTANVNETNRVAIPITSSLPAIAPVPNIRDNLTKFHYR